MFAFVYLHKKKVKNLYNSTNTVELIKKIAKNKNISIATLLSNCELNKNTLSSMTSRGSWIQSDSLAKIADYLGCSVDYLLGRTDDPESHIDKLSFLDERDHELVTSIIEKSYQRARSSNDNISVHELPRFKAVAHGGDILVNEPLEKPKIPD